MHEMNFPIVSPNAAAKRFIETLTSGNFCHLPIPNDMWTSFWMILQRIPAGPKLAFFNWDSDRGVPNYQNDIFDPPALKNWKEFFIHEGMLTTLEAHLDMLMQTFHMNFMHRFMREGWSYGPTFSREEKTLPELAPLSDLAESSDDYTKKYLGELKGLTACVTDLMSYYLLKDAKASTNAFDPAAYAKLVYQSAPGSHPFTDEFFAKIEQLVTREQRAIDIAFPERLFWTPSNTIFQLVNKNLPEELIRSELTTSEGAVAIHTARLSMIQDALHVTTLAHFMKNGWTYGDSFDNEAKTIPEFVRPEELSESNDVSLNYRCIVQNLTALIHHSITVCILNQYGKKKA